LQDYIFIFGIPLSGRAFSTRYLLRRGAQTYRSIPNAPIRQSHFANPNI